MKPVIGVSSAWSVETWGRSGVAGEYIYVGSEYSNAIYNSGAIPLVLAPLTSYLPSENTIRDIMERIDGLLLSGGGDAKTDSLNYKPSLIEQQRRRYEFEAQLIKEAWKRNMPVLGICRGHQMIVEVLGGVITTQLIKGHKMENECGELRHNIRILESTILEEICNEGEWTVTSYHCQAAETVPDCFRISAVSDDGVIEAAETDNRDFFIGVQFHPEMMLGKDEKAKRLFDRFVAAAERYELKRL